MKKWNWWQSIDIKYKGHNINSTKININNKNKSHNTFTNDTGDYSNNLIILNNGNNNNNNNKNNNNQTSNVRSRKK